MGVEAVLVGEESNDSGGGGILAPSPNPQLNASTGTAGHVCFKKQLATCICIGFGDKDFGTYRG